MLHKNSLRKILIARRQIIANKDEKNQLITQKFLDWFYQGDYKSIFTYVSINTEVDTKQIIKTLFDTTQIYVPLTMGNIRQYRLGNLNNLNADKRGNLDLRHYDFIDQQADICITPLLGYSSKLYRLGYGGGFYDKFLIGYSGIKVALAYDEQFQEFDNELHDIKMDMIITPTKIILA